MNNSYYSQPLMLFPEEAEDFKKKNKRFNKNQLKSSQNNSTLNLLRSNFKFYDNKKFQVNQNNPGFSKYNQIPLVHYQYINYYDYYVKNFNKNSEKNQFKTINPYSIQDKLKKEQEEKKKIKLQTLLIKEFNNSLKGKEDQLNEQYWQNKDTDKQEKEVEDFNEKVKSNLTQLSLNLPQNNQESGHIVVSNLINNIREQKINEENQQVQKPQEIGESILIPDTQQSLAFGFLSKKIQIKKLDDLLKNSERLRVASSSIKQGEKYTDKDFPATIDSIKGFGQNCQYTDQDLAKVQWKRPEEIFDSTKLKLYDKISPNDILQGNLGDCYFLSAISAISENPKRIEKLFLTKNYNSQGLYVIALCIDGIFTEVIIDDLIPTYQGKPFFNSSNENELYVILLEKAYAKIYGGYVNIQSGLTREALKDLTGAPAQTFFTKKIDKKVLWEQIVQANEQNFIMTAGSDDLNNGSDAYIEKIGIAGSHAYSLLETFELEKLGGGNYRLLTSEESQEGMNIEQLVKLRNPWGRGEWKGDWSDQSYKWTNEVMKMLNYTNQDDGIFFMNYNDFCQYFSDVQICYFHDEYNFSGICLESEKNVWICVEFTIEKAGQYYFNVSQEKSRQFPRSQGYSYSPILSIVVRKLPNGQFQYIGGEMDCSSEQFIQEFVEPGQYYAFLKPQWQSFVKIFSFSLYGPSTQELKINSSINIENTITEALLTHSRSHNHQKIYDLKSLNEPQIKYGYFNNQEGLGYCFFNNQSQKSTLEITVDFSGSRNIKLMNPHQGLKPTLQVDPGEFEIIVFQATNQTYSVSQRYATCIKKKQSIEEIRQQVKTTTPIIQKFYKGQKVQIQVHFIKYQSGYAMLYVNNSPNLILNEEVEFELQNCHIDSLFGTYLNFNLNPKQEKFINIVQDESGQEFLCKIKKMNYKINEK